MRSTLKTDLNRRITILNGDIPQEFPQKTRSTVDWSTLPVLINGKVSTYFKEWACSESRARGRELFRKYKLGRESKRDGATIPARASDFRNKPSIWFSNLFLIENDRAVESTRICTVTQVERNCQRGSKCWIPWYPNGEIPHAF